MQQQLTTLISNIARLWQMCQIDTMLAKRQPCNVKHSPAWEKVLLKYRFK